MLCKTGATITEAQHFPSLTLLTPDDVHIGTNMCDILWITFSKEYILKSFVERRAVYKTVEPVTFVISNVKKDATIQCYLHSVFAK
jgi:hypothetical protein